MAWAPWARWEPAAVLALALLVTGVAWVTQDRISLADGQGWDGVHYHAMAEQVAERQPIRAQAPWTYRFLVPAVVGLIAGEGGDFLAVFQAVNVAGGVAATFLLAVWLRAWVEAPALRLALVAGFVLQWHTPLRIVHYHPALVDPWFLAFGIGSLVVGQRLRAEPRPARWLALALLVFAATCVREAGLVFGVAALALGPPTAGIQRSPAWPPAAWAWRVLPVLAGASAIALSRLVAEPVGAFDFAATAQGHLLGKPAATYALAWFVAFGPMLVLPIAAWSTSVAWLRQNPAAALVLAGFAGLALIGGTDTERLLYWSFPVVLVLAGQAVEVLWPALRGLPLAVLLAAQALAHRLVWPIPDYPGTTAGMLPLFTLPSAHARYLDLWASYAPPDVRLVLLVEYAAVSVLLAAWLALRRAGPRPAPAAART